MQPGLTLFSIIMLVGAAHGLFLALTLINTRDARDAGRPFLAILTIAFAIDLGHEFLFQSGYLLSVLQLAFVDPIINLLYGPSFYLYVRVLTEGSSFKPDRKLWLHALPAVISVVACIFLPRLNAEQFAQLFYEDMPASSSNEIRVLSVIGYIALGSAFSIGFYLFLSIKRLVQHAKLIREQFSYQEKITLRWLRNLLIALSVLYGILIFDGLFAGVISTHEDINHLMYLMVVAVIYVMGYMGMKQPAVFLASQPEAGNSETSESEDTPKYKTSALDTEMSAALCEELQQYMETEKPYLENQLTLPQLAQQVGISPNYLSQVINEQLKVNFFDFINEYRVSEAKSMLATDSEKKANIIDIAHESGFNSKTAFYKAFKKHVGMTPSDFSKANPVG